MLPRLSRLRALAQLADFQHPRSTFICSQCSYATVAATTPAPSDAHLPATLPTSRYPPTQLPSHRNPAYRKSQLLRSYVSLLQTTPLIVFFQHSNLKAAEWVGIRRELVLALRRLDTQLAKDGTPSEGLIAEYVRLQIVKTNIFEAALRVSEYYQTSPTPPAPLEDMASVSSEREDPALTHALSEAAYRAAKSHEGQHPLASLLTGAVAILTFPTVSPQHLKAAFSILSPQAPAFAAPTRRVSASYYDGPVQDGLKKLFPMGARVEDQVFDVEGARWVGGIEGGMIGLRAQLVALLQGAGVGVTRTLESASRNLWITMENRRHMLADEVSPKEGAHTAGLTLPPEGQSPTGSRSTS